MQLDSTFRLLGAIGGGWVGKILEFFFSLNIFVFWNSFFQHQGPVLLATLAAKLHSAGSFSMKIKTWWATLPELSSQLKFSSNFKVISSLKQNLSVDNFEAGLKRLRRECYIVRRNWEKDEISGALNPILYELWRSQKCGSSEPRFTAWEWWRPLNDLSPPASHGTLRSSSYFIYYNHYFYYYHNFYFSALIFQEKPPSAPFLMPLIIT